MIDAMNRKNRTVNRGRVLAPALFLGFLAVGFALQPLAKRQGPASVHADEVAATFKPFGRTVKTRSDDKNFYVESNGMPNHEMMVGITSWQQQVPIPQNYTGRNAWQFPLKPVPAANPMSAKTHFFRGAIALAANGIPIFNALNNRGEDSYAIGELDKFGGHCGRADDYHYHIAPTHLQKTVGPSLPIGYALDGYALYGLTEPDGSSVSGLDSFNGHTTAKLGYHYHATKTYPYLNGGFHGEVTEIGGQVDPQPRANGIRPALPPLRGAKITSFSQAKPGSYSLTYTLNGSSNKVNYVLQADGSYKFDYVDSSGQTKSETYSGRGGQREPGGPGRNGGQRGEDRRGSQNPPDRERPPRGDGPQAPTKSEPEVKLEIPATPNFVLSSPSVGKDGKLPTEFTGDGDSISPPLEWKGAPKGTKSFAVIMHHIDPEGMTKWYWTLYDLPAETTSLPKGVNGVGTSGNNSIDNRLGYAPPHSKGPGLKTYVLTVYALDAKPSLSVPPRQVSRHALMEAMKGHVLGAAVLKVNYTRNP